MIAIYFKTEDFEECLSKCKLLSKINPRNEYASLMISELMIINNQGQQALEQFESLFQKNPQNMGLLSKLMILYIRNGEIKKAKESLEKAENLSQNKNEPGLCFCRGILYKNMGQNIKALKELNKAKRHQAYVDESVRHMLEIFINPNQDLYISFSEEINSVKQIDPENIKGAENALLDCKDRSTDQIKFMSLFAKLLLFGKQDLQIITGVSSKKKLKSQEFVDQAQQILMKILQDKPNSHVSLLYLAIAKYQQKKPLEAKQCLQKIVQSSYQSDQGEIYEMASMILADGLMYERNFEEAEKILKQAFLYNKNNGKIMEVLGVIKEKQQDLQLSTQCYQKGWELSNCTSASLGLAQNYLRLKKIPQCIEVCEKVIKQYPNYPRIDKEIMQKAILQIKSSG